MQAFEYVMVLVSIIIALGVAELLGGVVRILRGELRFYWIHAIWVFNMFMLQLQYCWSLFDLEARNEWVFVDLVHLLVPPILLFLASSLLFPSRNERCELAEFYYFSRKPIFGLLAVVSFYYGALSFSMSMVSATQFTGVAVMGILFFSPRLRTHALLTVAYAIGNVAAVVSFSNKLGESSF